MVDFFLAVLAGLICGVLSGFGIGGGSLLMVWLTALLSMDQRTAQGINLLYFLPAAGCSLIFHVKNRQIVWKAVVPAAIAGCLTAIPGALLAGSVRISRHALSSSFSYFHCSCPSVSLLSLIHI